MALPKKLMRWLWIGLVTLLAIVIVLELALRWLLTDYIPPGHDSPAIWQYHPAYGWIGRPDIDVPFRQAAFSIRVQHNHLGQRDTNLTENVPRKKRMLVIGDSFVWCYGVDINECFVNRLESKHKDWDIINGGIAGTGTDQQYLYLKDKLGQLQPDVVLLLMVQNDFQDITKTQHNNYYKPYFLLQEGKLLPQQQPVPPSTLSQSFARWVTGRSYLYTLGSQVAWLAGNALRQQLGMEVSSYDPYRGFRFGKTFPLMQALLRTMADEAEQSGARLVLVHGQMLDNLRLTVQAVADERDLPYHNLDRAFAGRAHREYQIPGDAHWNALGHQLVADDLDQFLKESGIFTAP